MHQLIPTGWYGHVNLIILTSFGQQFCNNLPLVRCILSFFLKKILNCMPMYFYVEHVCRLVDLESDLL